MDSSKDKNSNDESREIQKSEPLSLFTKDKNFLFIYKKTEKLVSAVYIVSGLFPSEEPMRWRIRESSIELMSLVVSLKDRMSGSGHDDFIELIKSEVMEIVSLLEVAYFSGLLSEMNFSVLSQEFSALLNAVSAKPQPEAGSGRYLLSSDFFSVEDFGRSQEKENPTLPAGEKKYKGHIPSKTNYSQFIKDKSFENKFSKSEKESVGDKASENASEKKYKTPRSQENVEAKKTKRKDVIVDIVREKKEITVKDISAVVTDCSEKTLQRDLQSLVKKGVLKREGERRWSKYSLRH